MSTRCSWWFRLVCPAFVILLSGCDPIINYHVYQPGARPIVCPGGEEMRYTVVESDEYGTETTDFVVDPDPTPLSTDPDHVMAGLVKPPQYVDWMQFTVYCGESDTPYLATKKITADDWVKENEYNYRYIIE